MFVVVEGPNGSGKTTLIKSLGDKGYETLSSPNGTPLAKMLRPACRGVAPWEGIDKKIQFLLFSAARLDEYHKCVHGKEEVVVADRWWTSTYVYQCMFEGISVEFMENTIHDEEKIDLVILLDCEEHIVLERMKAERENNPDHGKCTWTKEDDTLRQLRTIYREKLPPYLEKVGIRYESIDTTNKTSDEVLKEATILIERVRKAI